MSEGCAVALMLIDEFLHHLKTPVQVVETEMMFSELHLARCFFSPWTDTIMMKTSPLIRRPIITGRLITDRRDFHSNSQFHSLLDGDIPTLTRTARIVAYS